MVTLAVLVVLLLSTFVVSLFSIRLGAIAFFSIVGFVLLQHFGPIAVYEANRMANGGYHEREIDGVVYRVTLNAGDKLQFAGHIHPARISELRFITNVSGVGVVSFGLSGIDQPISLPSNCEAIGGRYGLIEVAESCALTTRRYPTDDFVFETSSTDPRVVRLICSDRFAHEHQRYQRCRGTFQIDGYTLWVWLSLIDPARWPEVYTQLEALLGNNFSRVSN